MSRPNTTQRSWSNYEGDNPIKRWVGKPSYGSEAQSYTDSSKFGPGSTWTEREEEEEPDDKSGKAKKKKSSLSDSMDKARDQAKSSPKPKASPVKRNDSESDLPPGYRLNEDGEVVNPAGYVQNEKWYTIDPKTGKKRMKTPQEAGMYDGGRVYQHDLL